MATSEKLQEIPTLRDTIPGQRNLDPRQRPPIYLLDNFYFMLVGERCRERVRELAEQISQISRGRKTRILDPNSEITGKVGEFIIENFLKEQCGFSFHSNIECINPTGGDRCDFEFGKLKVDVKTRQLHTDETIAPLFDLLVPHAEADRYQDLYLLSGYCPATHYGYALGWATWEEIQARPVRQDIRLPARCIPLVDLHPMSSLETYVQRALD